MREYAKLLKKRSYIYSKYQKKIRELQEDFADDYQRLAKLEQQEIADVEKEIDKLRSKCKKCKHKRKKFVPTSGYGEWLCIDCGHRW